MPVLSETADFLFSVNVLTCVCEVTVRGEANANNGSHKLTEAASEVTPTVCFTRRGTRTHARTHTVS